MILSSIEYMGNYELSVITESEDEGFARILEHLEKNGIGLNHYDTYREFVADTISHDEVVEGEIFIR